MRRGRTIHQVQAKFVAIHDILYGAGQISAADMKALAAFLEIKYSTLKSTLEEGRLSAEIEQQVCSKCRFGRHEPRWVDPEIPDKLRENFAVSGYQGRDTVESFRDMLSEIWFPERQPYRALASSPEVANRFLARHLVTDCGQATPHGGDMQLFLEADFDAVHDASGVVYGFRRVRLDIDIRCANGGNAIRWLGHGTPAEIGDAQLSAHAMSLQPRWLLEHGKAGDILKGEYATRETPLFELTRFQAGTMVESSMSANLHDGSVSTPGTDIALTPNQREIIKQICAAELARDIKADGWITLSRHSLTVTKEAG